MGKTGQGISLLLHGLPGSFACRFFCLHPCRKKAVSIALLSLFHGNCLPVMEFVPPDFGAF